MKQRTSRSEMRKLFHVWRHYPVSFEEKSGVDRSPEGPMAGSETNKDRNTDHPHDVSRDVIDDLPMEPSIDKRTAGGENDSRTNDEQRGGRSVEEKNRTFTSGDYR